MKNIVKIRFSIFLSLSLSLFISFALANDQVLVEGNLISINTNNVSLKEILTELHHKTGLTFHIDDLVKNEIISMKVVNQSLEKVLRRLLKEFDKSITYDRNGKIERVEIFPKGLKITETIGKGDVESVEPVPVMGNKTDFIPPTEFDNQMEISNSTGSGPIDNSSPEKASGMNITIQTEQRMDIVLPEEKTEGM